ncbi:hypothetical protein V0U79_03395 [Hyphobacterium sp. HN65]|uniref:VOC domain-containing protein n=1 Tax=Hyphobacterium lacteum TaxID=3116575 RepID=A0ABU7LNA0_9PROT|nr:hypothetical protein [Hyphobacterium sp. HN65]MEE2525398.1 hypothetical protein [Hyphobacterium sp. HN65]
MKFGELKSVGHNLAASFASGIGMMVGQYLDDVPYAEIRKADGDFLEIDFLSGTVSGIKPSPPLETYIDVFVSKGLQHLCDRHGLQRADFAGLKVCFFSGPGGSGFIVTVTDKNGNTSSDEYAGYGERVWEIDDYGRARRKPGEKGRIEPSE